MKIENTEVGGLYRSMASAGLPKGDAVVPKVINKLGQARAGSGHDCFLKGIKVWSRVTADHSFWIQWLRYHFHDITSSTSKMHTILTGEVVWDELVDDRVKMEWKRLKAIAIKDNTPESFERLIMNTPMGLMLTVETSTNYLQLKSIYTQRKTHKMSAWRDYCSWIEELPKFLELTQK